MAEYALGQSDEALQRLIEQAEFLKPITVRMLRSAGLACGMRVLDIGCGAGDSTFHAAELAGLDGHVLGMDSAAEPIALAQQRAEAAGLRNVSFRQGTEADLEQEAPFDAIVGRYVLIYQPDGIAFVRRLAERLRPGGVLSLQEVDFTRSIQASPPMARLDAMLAGVVAVMATAAADAGAATRMPAIFAEAGLSAPSGFCERPIGLEGGETFFRWAASSFAVLKSRIIPDLTSIEIDRLVADLKEEVAAIHGCALGPDQWCIWAKKL